MATQDVLRGGDPSAQVAGVAVGDSVEIKLTGSLVQNATTAGSWPSIGQVLFS